MQAPPDSVASGPLPPLIHIGFPSPSISTVDTAGWAGLARHCEAAGFDTLWHSNERFFREMWIRMTVSILATTRLGIGGAVVEPYAVHPAITAQSLATAVELSGGRATLAIGAGGAGFPAMGLERRRPVTALREAFGIIGKMLAGESVTLEGELATVRGARIHFPTSRVPLWLASRGDQVLRLGGEVADGVMIATYADPPEILQAVELVRGGMARAGRPPGAVRLMSRVETCVHADPERAREGCRLMVAKLLWGSYPDRGFVERAGLEVPAALEAFNAERDYDRIAEVAGQVPDEFVDKFCWAGTPEDVAGRIAAAVCDAGMDEVGLWILTAGDQTLSEAIDIVAAEVIPRARSLVARRRVGQSAQDGGGSA